MSDHEHGPWCASNIAGSILVFVGVAIFVMWMADYAGFIRPDDDPLVGPILLVAGGAVGFGSMLVKGEGASIGEAVKSWLPGRGGDGS